MFLRPLKLSNYEACATRNERLQRVVHFLEVRGGISPLVTRLHDHKGILFVCWSREPDNLDTVRLLYAAWEDQSECNVCHVIGDDPYGPRWVDDNGGPASPEGKRFNRIDYVLVT